MTLEQWVKEVNAAELGGVQAAEFVHMADVAAKHTAKRELADLYDIDDATYYRIVDNVWASMSEDEWWEYVDNGDVRIVPFDEVG